MTIILTILTAKYLPIVINIVLIFVSCLAALTIGNLWWSLIRRIYYDLIAFYRSYQTDKNSAIKTRVELEIWQRRARAELRDRRLALQVGSAAMWRAGAHDVMVEETK